LPAIPLGFRLLVVGFVGASALAVLGVGCFSLSPEPTSGPVQCQPLVTACARCFALECTVTGDAGACARAYTTVSEAPDAGPSGTYPCISCLDTAGCEQSAYDECASVSGYDGGIVGPSYDAGLRPPDGGYVWLPCLFGEEAGPESLAYGCGGDLVSSPGDGGYLCSGGAPVSTCPTTGLAGCCTDWTTGTRRCRYGLTDRCQDIQSCTGTGGQWSPTP
jgi:hypothetical protein